MTKVSVVSIAWFSLACLLILLGTVIVNVYYHYKQNIHVMDIYGSNTMYSVDSLVQDMDRISLMCFSDSNIKGMIQTHRKASEKEQYDNVRYMERLYTSLITIRSEVTGVYLFDREGLIFYQDLNSRGRKLDRDVDRFLEEIYQKEPMDGNVVGNRIFVGKLPEFMRYDAVYYQDVYQEYCLYLARSVQSLSPYAEIGWIALLTPVQKTRELIEKNLEEGISYLLVYADGSIVCGQEAHMIGENLQEQLPEIYDKIQAQETHFLDFYQGEFCQMSYQESDYSGMNLITIKPVRLILSEVRGLVGYCSIIVLVCMLLILISVYLTTKKNLGRVTDFAWELSCFELSNLDQRYPIDKRDEVGMLKESFNHMMDTINRLMVSEYQGKIELQKMQLQEQRLSMLYLKNQINPHFLYNTLDMIRIKAALNKDTEVSHMLMQLVDFYRLSTKVENTLVSIGHEVKMLDTYMELMCYRYPKLSYETEVQEELTEMKIPNFILQPLMENSLIHGMRDRGYQGTIQLKVHRVSQERIQIQILDDGMGISEEGLERIREQILADDKEELQKDREHMHIGVSNIWKRLQLFYGAACDITFENRPVGGASVTIRLPEYIKE